MKWQTIFISGQSLISDDLICNDPIAYADLILNGNPEVYLKAVTEYKILNRAPKVSTDFSEGTVPL